MFVPRKERPETIAESHSNIRLPASKIRQILRTVPHDKAFHFYEEIGKPTQHKAANLFEFRNRISVVQVSSLIFHLRRRDFEKWINDIIGDPELAKRISNISPQVFNLKMKLYSTVNFRIKELREMHSSWKTTSQNVLVTPRYSYPERSR